MKNDVFANRAAQKWSRKELMVRLIWGVASPLFRFSPRVCWGWRVFMLRLFGARIGREVHIYPTVRIVIPWNLEIADQTAVGDYAVLYALGPINLGSRVTISQGAHLCAGSHDYTRANRPLTKPPIDVESDVWVAADAFIGPSVKVGAGTIVGARSVVVRDVPPNCIVAGNPARMVRTLVDDGRNPEIDSKLST